MALTRTNLEDRCLQYGYGELDRTRFQDFLNQRYRDVLGRHRWSWNRSTSTVTLSINTNSATFASSGYIFFGRLRPTVLDVIEPELKDWDTDAFYSWTQRAFDSNIKGPPSEYSVVSETIYFNSFADKTYTYEANFWALPAYMTAGTSEPLIPDEDREVLVAGALMDACLRDKDYQGSQMWNQIYEGRIDEMWRKDRANNTENAYIIPMPRHYYGVFDH